MAVTADTTQDVWLRRGQILSLEADATMVSPAV